jgi:multidrug efflux pump subunit AcrB
MTSIPFALVGAVLGHWLMGSDFTVLSMIGAVALTGIVVNDSIILVDFINKSRREGMRTTAAVVRGARNRLRAILLTSVTTICGLAPLMLETSFQAQFLIPMAISLVFGLAFATIVTPILLPCFYLIYEDIFAATRWIFTGRFDRNVRMRSDEMPA